MAVSRAQPGSLNHLGGVGVKPCFMVGPGVLASSAQGVRRFRPRQAFVCLPCSRLRPPGACAGLLSRAVSVGPRRQACAPGPRLGRPSCALFGGWRRHGFEQPPSRPCHGAQALRRASHFFPASGLARRADLPFAARGLAHNGCDQACQLGTRRGRSSGARFIHAPADLAELSLTLVAGACASSASAPGRRPAHIQAGAGLDALRQVARLSRCPRAAAPKGSARRGGRAVPRRCSLGPAERASPGSAVGQVFLGPHCGVCASLSRSGHAVHAAPGGRGLLLMASSVRRQPFASRAPGRAAGLPGSVLHAQPAALVAPLGAPPPIG